MIRSELPRAAPQQVAAVAARNLSAPKAHGLRDVAGFAPGLSPAASGPISLIAMGVTTGRQLSSAVGLHIDEAPIGAFAQAYVGLPLE